MTGTYSQQVNGRVCAWSSGDPSCYKTMMQVKGDALSSSIGAGVKHPQVCCGHCDTQALNKRDEEQLPSAEWAGLLQVR